MRTRATPPLTLLVVLSLGAGVAGACSATTASDLPEPSGGPGAPPSGRVSLPPVGSGVVPGAVPDDVLASVTTAAAAEAGVDPTQVTVVSAESTTWGDGSLGCPEPGKMYTQALVDGYHVVVEVDGQELDYRVGNGQVRLCEGFEPGGASG
jgi:hypothetical protein